MNFIAQKRAEKQLTQRQLAEMVGITYQSLQRYENETVIPSVTIALRIAQALDTPINELFLFGD